MAKVYDVSLTRTTVETATITVEAQSKEKAILAAALQVKPEDFRPKSTATDLDDVQWRETIGPED